MTKIFVDTNKYLDFYRYKEENKEILDKLSSSNNLIITEQVIREFKRNRIVEVKRLLDKIESKEKEITSNMCSLEPLGIFTDKITKLNKDNSKLVNKIKENYKPLKQEIEKMIDDESNDDVLCTFNTIIGNTQTIIIEDNDYAYNLALKRNKLGGVPRSDKSGFKNLTICDEYIWESLLRDSNYNILFVTRDDTYLENSKILMEEYKEKTGKTIKFVKYVSAALSELGEVISEEAMEKEQNEQEDLLMASKIRDITGIDIDELDGLLLTLTMREEEIIRLRFGLNGDKPKTLEEVSKIFGISVESVRKIESKALRKLRNRYVHGGREGNIIVSL